MLTTLCVRVSRKISLVLVTAGLMGSAWSCNETAPPPPQKAELTVPVTPKVVPSNAPNRNEAPLPTQPPVAVSPAGPTASVGPTSPTASVPKPPVIPPSVVQEPVNIPVNAQWTIFTGYRFENDDHVTAAMSAKDGLKKKTRRADWYVIHGQRESLIYFGYYQSVYLGDLKNIEEAKRAQSDLKMVQSLVDKTGRRFFEHAQFISLEAPDPNAPPEWNLFNVDRDLVPQDPKRAYWSLQIMAFRAHEQRKEAAVDVVRQLRAKNVEAYYYHGESISSVCVGHWPANALKAQNRTEKLKDQADANIDSNLAVSNVPLDDLKDPSWDGTKPRPIDNKPTVAVAPKIEILDPTLRAMMADERFKYHAVNYETGKVVNGKTVMNPSFLVVIPRAPGNGLYDSAPAASNVAGGAAQPGRSPNGLRGPNMLIPTERTTGTSDSRTPR